MTETTDSIEVPEPGQSQGDGGDDAGRTRRGGGGRRGKKGPLGRLALFYRQIVAELRKVVWPTRRQLSTYTTVVIIFVVIVIALVTVIDWGFTEVMKYIFG